MKLLLPLFAIIMLNTAIASQSYYPRYDISGKLLEYEYPEGSNYPMEEGHLLGNFKKKIANQLDALLKKLPRVSNCYLELYGTTKFWANWPLFTPTQAITHDIGFNLSCQDDIETNASLTFIIDEVPQRFKLAYFRALETQLAHVFNTNHFFSSEERVSSKDAQGKFQSLIVELRYSRSAGAD